MVSTLVEAFRAVLKTIVRAGATRQNVLAGTAVENVGAAGVTHLVGAIILPN
ncbi:hypothetical protein MesoLjLb_49640 [Mesorhizobium sp. L-8-3]|nr:hypothetical protein MesoLjLb_49640 [Mesorhizobium sp. L-8-3]